MFENELNKVYEVIDENDFTIASLNLSLQKTQESLENGKTIEQDKFLNKLEAPILKSISPFCDYQARSSNGHKSHISRKHAEYDENLSSYKCEICGNEQGNGKYLKKHMFPDSYKRFDELKYKCDDCDFWGPKEHTMKMHMCRNHYEIIV